MFECKKRKSLSCHNEKNLNELIGGISNKGNFKFGGGYRGWIVEAELKENFNQIFFGYQYQF